MSDTWMGSLAEPYKPLPWGSDPWSNRIGPTPEMVAQRDAQRDAERASWNASQAYQDQQANNADITQAYRGVRLDPGIRREPGSVAPTPQAEGFGNFVGEQLTDPVNYLPGGVATKGGRALLAAATMGSVLAPEDAQAGVAGVIKKATSRARDPRFWHQISDVKLAKPIEDYSSTHVPRAPMQDKPLNIEDLKGSYLLPTISDTTRADTTLTHIGDRKLPSPVEMQGGARFPGVNDPAVWMANNSQMTGLVNRVGEIGQKTGADVYTVPTALGGTGADYSHHVWSPLVDIVKNTKGITKDARSQFDDVMRGVDPNFPGLKANRDTLQRYFNEASRGPRTTFVQAMDSRRFQDLGFPDVAAVRHAAIDPTLLHAPLGSSGFSVFKVDPSQGVKAMPGAHGTYSHGALGQYTGDMGIIAPHDLMFRDMTQSLAHMAEDSGKKLGKYVGRPDYYFAGRMPEKTTAGRPVHRAQFVDDQLIDAVNDYKRRYLKVGGAAALASGMTMAEIAKADEAAKANSMGSLAAFDEYDHQ